MRSNREGKMFIKDKTKVACRMSGIERRVVYFRKLLFETDNEIMNEIMNSFVLSVRLSGTVGFFSFCCFY